MIIDPNYCLKEMNGTDIIDSKGTRCTVGVFLPNILSKCKTNQYKCFSLAKTIHENLSSDRIVIDDADFPVIEEAVQNHIDYGPLSPQGQLLPAIIAGQLIDLLKQYHGKKLDTKSN